jgi:hypothetical protein
MGFFKRKPGSDQPVQHYLNLRDFALHVTPDNFAEEFRGAPILTLMWETGLAKGVGTLVGAIDGHVAWYHSNGGGIMGNWTSPALTDSNTRWLEMGVTVLPQLPVIAEPALPGDGMTQFVAVTPTGVRAAGAAFSELEGGRHALSPFFYAAVKVFTALNDEADKARQATGG